MSDLLNFDDIKDMDVSNAVLSRASSGSTGVDSSGSSNASSLKKFHQSPVTSLIGRVSLTKLCEERKARRCRFYRNGDQWFPGAIIAIGNDKHRTWEALLEDLTRVLNHPQHLASGVRHIFTLKGAKVVGLENLIEGSEYVASSTENFKSIDYQTARLPQWRIHAKRKEALHVSSPKYSIAMTQSANSPINSYTPYINTNSVTSPEEDCKEFLKPKLITVIRNGIRPRKAARILLNHRTARSFEQVLNDMTEAIRLDTGAVRKIFSLAGKQITKLKEFFGDENIFIAFGRERHFCDDFELDPDEYKLIQPHLKGSVSPRRHLRMASPQPRGRPISPLVSYDGSGSLPRAQRRSRFHASQKRAQAAVAAATQANLNGRQGYQMCEQLYPYEVLSRYSLGPLLGDGNFAVVRLCVLKATGEQFALKVIEKAKCRGKEHMIDTEVEILRRISHPNIVSLIEEVDSPDYLYLVMELVRGGDLFDAIASATKYTEAEARVMINDLARSLHYLHVRNIVHRDIKPENLLVEVGPEGETRLKLGDFGLAVEVTEPLRTVCGTPTYVAPEILAETGYGLEVDIWACGVITYILLCGFPPFVSATNSQDELFDQIMRGSYEFHSPYWDDVSTAARELIARMLRVEQDRRLTAEQVLHHPWIQTAPVRGIDLNGSAALWRAASDAINENVPVAASVSVQES